MYDSHLRGLWLAIILLLALVAAVCAGVLARALEAAPAAAMGTGGATFVAVVTLGLAIHRHLRDS